MNDGDMAQRLAAAAAAMRERETTLARHGQLKRSLADADSRVLALSQAHTAEVRDVERLETLTLTRVRAALADNAEERERMLTGPA
ncbi:hypothetical protein [Catellatospora sp. IY07-71]|uniref:hypothetical protein n=1 Tax=Catellatospora sp. IY07-71 TaxID=2728827 RepID=UPI001BB3A50F|nr:hypothetical protein [Catellatospora sp. IY07-71]